MKTTALSRLCLAALAAVLLFPSAAAAQADATQYNRVLAREAAARKQKAPTLATLRAIAASYEAIPRRWPRSGYADNALWQGAGVLELAYARSRSTVDRNNAARLLRWLSREYPSSSLRRQANAKVAALTAPAPRPAAVARAATPAPAPPVEIDDEEEPAAPEADAPAPAPAPSAPARAAVAAATPNAPAGAGPTPVAIAVADLPKPSGPAATIRRVWHEPLPKGERITVELNQEPLYTNSRAMGNPDRLTVDIANATAAPAVVAQLAAARGILISSAALKSLQATTTLVLDLTGRPRHSIFTLYNPFRLVIDIERDSDTAMVGPAPTPAITPRAAAIGPAPARGETAPPVPAPMPIARGSNPTPPARPATTPAAPTATPAAVTVAASTPPVSDAVRTVATPATPAVPDDEPIDAIPTPVTPAAGSRGDFSLARQLGLGVARIVIDPGHGGHDPGAVRNGVTESELVLDIAKRVEQILLRQPGVEVVLTRRTNQFVALEERTGIANREGADLFLSIHANSSPRTATRGVETYFLNFATNPEAEALAARENASGAQTMRRMPALLQAIALNSKLDESREFASAVQSTLVRRLQARDKAVRDLGIKQAPFVVLIGAGMPSILAEIAFVSNRAEAALLKQSAYRQQIAQGIADGVIRYQAALKKVNPVATTANQR